MLPASTASYDYNLTAQLVTDGIKETSLPRWIVTSTSQQGTLKKNQRELMPSPLPRTRRPFGAPARGENPRMVVEGFNVDAVH